MPNYKAPVKDMRFVLQEVLDIDRKLAEIPQFQQVSSELSSHILEEGAKICEELLFPLNQSGDREGCHFEGGKVRTPAGFKEAYKTFTEAGWTSLSAAEEFGGQGMPKCIDTLLEEMLCSSNVSFSLYTGLTQGACHALQEVASEELKNTYLPNMVSGKWSGVMCLTEAHCGTDLGLVKTKATVSKDGGYRISGTKIFVTSGEQDLTENIIYLLLARLPDAPPGIKGISMFLAPKFLVNDSGELGKRNGMQCGSIEHKMGIKASSTCVINFDDAVAYLVGEPHKGMQAMFTMMNRERLSIGMQGLGLAEVSYQNALQYAKERLQGRAPSGALYPEKDADPIIVHPDVRRMLLLMKSHNEAARLFSVWLALQLDIAKYHPDENERVRAESLVALFTPVAKAFFTDCGFEACNLGIQILGGHGYVNEWGIEQYVRDVRIAQIYEGTNGVQAFDLVRRKLVENKGASLQYYTELLSEFIDKNSGNEEMHEFIEPLDQALQELIEVSAWIITTAEKDPAVVGASSVDFLHLLGLVCFGYSWAQMAEVSLPKKNVDHFYRAKLKTARFFMKRVLPMVQSLSSTIYSGSECLTAMEISEF